jgi:arsenate reductase-like glutaredoxin family protein
MDELLLRIGRVTTEYYNQLNSKKLTEEEFKLWIESLEEPMRGVFNKKGLQECKGVLNFQRFILELRDKGLEEYLKENLTEEELSYWIANK